MQEAICNRCGASVVLSAKFCRQCGNLLDTSEMTTRSLDAPSAEPPPYDHPTRPANAGITSPTYAPPAMMPPHPPPIIGNAPPANNRTALLVFLALGLTMLIGLGVVAFVVLGKFSSRQLTPPPPPVTFEKAPPPPGVPGGIPSVPPAPPAPPPPGSVKSSLDPALIYPGAQVTMEVMGGAEGQVTQLQTSDSFDKVVDWYAGKLKPKSQVTIPGGRILESENFVALITSTGDGTNIMLTRKGKGDK